MPAMAAVMKNPQQNPHKPRMLKMSDRTASCSLLRGGTTFTGPAGTTEVVASVGMLGGAAVAGAALTPGRVERAAQPVAPSYHPRSLGRRVPAASCRLISSNEKT